MQISKGRIKVGFCSWLSSWNCQELKHQSQWYHDLSGNDISSLVETFCSRWELCLYTEITLPAIDRLLSQAWLASVSLTASCTNFLMVCWLESVENEVISEPFIVTNCVNQKYLYGSTLTLCLNLVQPINVSSYIYGFIQMLRMALAACDVYHGDCVSKDSKPKGEDCQNKWLVFADDCVLNSSSEADMQHIIDMFSAPY